MRRSDLSNHALDLSQTNLLSILKKIFPEAELDLDGMCHGLCYMYLYGKILDTLPIENDHQRDGNTWFRNVCISLARLHPIYGIKQTDNQKRTEFFRLLNHITLGQEPSKFLFGVSQSNITKFFMDTKKRKLKNDFLAILSTIEDDPENNTAIKDLSKKLKTFISISDNKMIFIESHNHVTAIFKQGTSIYFYDPNCKSGEKKFTTNSSYKELADALFQAHEYVKKIPSFFNVSIFDFDKRNNKYLTPKYPTPEMLLGKNPILEAYVDPSSIGLLFLPNTFSPNERHFFDLLEKNSLARSYVFIGDELFYIYLEKENNRTHHTASLKITTSSASTWSELKKLLLALTNNTDLQTNEQSKCISLNLSISQLAEITFQTQHTTYYAERVSPLHLAVYINDIKTMEYLIKKGAKVDALDHLLNTPLKIAIGYNHLKAVELLLAHGANIHYKEIEERVALIYAINNADIEIIRALIQSGANVNDRCPEGFSALLQALYRPHLDLKLIQLLVEKGADIHATTPNGDTVLEVAVFKGALAIVEYLLNKGAVTNGNNLDKALMTAIEKGRDDIVQLLIQHKANINYILNKQSPLSMAIKMGNLNIVKILLDSGANVNFIPKHRSPLYLAVKKNNENLVELLLAKKPDLDFLTTDEQFSALHLAAANKNLAIAKQLIDAGANVHLGDGSANTCALHYANDDNEDLKNLAMTKLLLDHGAFIDAQNADGITPLYLAAEFGCVNVVKLLLQRGAKVDLANGKNITPLMTAAKSGHAKIVKLLLEYNADITLIGPHGKSALHYAAKKASSNDTLLNLFEYHREKSFKLNVDLLNDRGETPLYLALQGNALSSVAITFIENGADINFKMKDGKTPLYVAIEKNKIKVVQFILAKSSNKMIFSQDTNLTPPLFLAMQNKSKEMIELLLQVIDVNEKDTYGNTALHIAAQNGNVEMMETLLEYEADQNAVNEVGDFPLLLAVKNKREKAISLLLERNVDVNAQDANGNTALHVAAQNGDLVTMRLLLKHGADLNITNKQGYPPQRFAVENGHAEAGKYILNVQANPNFLNNPIREGKANGLATHGAFAKNPRDRGSVIRPPQYSIHKKIGSHPGFPQIMGVKK